MSKVDSRLHFYNLGHVHSEEAKRPISDHALSLQHTSSKTQLNKRGRVIQHNTECWPFKPVNWKKRLLKSVSDAWFCLKASVILTAGNQAKTRRLGNVFIHHPIEFFISDGSTSLEGISLFFDWRNMLNVFVPWEHWTKNRTVLFFFVVVFYGCAHNLLAAISWRNDHTSCHSKANITLTTSRLRAISSRMQCCCHSWFSFL